MTGETVEVMTSEIIGKDDFNGDLLQWTAEPVENVLVAPGDVADNIETTRPDGTDVKYTLYFPKTFDKDLEGCSVMVRGERLDVIGRPDHFDEINCPTEWWEVVKVGVLHG